MDAFNQALETDFIRLPGLFRKWELPDIVELGPAYRFENAGTTEDGTSLFAIYVHASLEHPKGKELLDATAAARLLGKTRKALIKAAYRGSIKSIRVGHQYFFVRKNLLGEVD